MKILIAAILIVLSAFIGAFWALALNCKIMTGLAVGGIAGLPIGVFGGMVQKAISKSTNQVTKTITMLIVLPSLLLFFFFGMGAGLILWLIRIVFF